MLNVFLIRLPCEDVILAKDMKFEGPGERVCVGCVCAGMCRCLRKGSCEGKGLNTILPFPYSHRSSRNWVLYFGIIVGDSHVVNVIIALKLLHCISTDDENTLTF